MELLWTVLRIVGVISCGIILWFLASARFRQWEWWNTKTRNHWYALTGWNFFGLYASLEGLVTGTPGGSRLIVLMLVVALSFRALLTNEELRADGGPPWKRYEHDSD